MSQLNSNSAVVVCLECYILGVGLFVSASKLGLLIFLQNLFTLTSKSLTLCSRIISNSYFFD